MSRRHPIHRFPRILVLAALLLPAAVIAKPTIGEDGIDRPSAHTAMWCPDSLYTVVRFVADGPEATLEFTGRIHSSVNPGSDLNNRVDNVCVVESAVFDNNLVNIPAFDPNLPCGQYDIWCLDFPNLQPAEIVYLETFAAGAGGWDTSDHAFWEGSDSAPNDFNDLSNQSGGSLQLGTQGDPDTHSSSSFTLTGLTAGQEYVLSFWWRCNDDPEPVELTITVYGTLRFTDATDGHLTDTYAAWGVSWVDYDEDGDDDLYLSRESENQLFLNDSGVFVNVTASPEDDPRATSCGVWAGVEEPRPWLYVVARRQPNLLLRNGPGAFTDVTSGPLGDAGDGRGAAWADVDNDNRIDLAVANFWSSNLLLRNTTGATFADSTPPALADPGAATQPVWCDADHDGDADLFVPFLNGQDRFFRNDGGSLTLLTGTPLAHTGPSNGAAWADYDNDGDFDLFVTRFDAPDCLYRNEGGLVFVDVTPPVLADAGMGYAPVWLDFDNDGHQDLFVVKEDGPNRLYRNLGGGAFAYAPSVLEDPNPAWSAATADYDNDGRPDLYLGNRDVAGRLFRNDYAYGGHWLQIELKATVSNPSAIGARIRVIAQGHSQIRQVAAGEGYLSQNSRIAHFGMGEASQADFIRVEWPSGIVQDTTLVALDQRIVICEAQNELAVPGGGNPADSRLRAVPNPVQASTSLHFDLEEPGPVRVAVYDLQGRPVRTLADGIRAAGAHAVTWDRRDDAGRRVPGGVYFARLAGGGPETAPVTRKLVLLP